MTENNSGLSKKEGEKPNLPRPSKKTIEDLFKLLSMGGELNDVQKKQMSDYKFWKTQPVVAFDEKIVHEGPIDSIKKVSDVRSEPYNLLNEFEWVTMDLSDEKQLDDVYQLLHGHYVEDQDATFRFNYSSSFFNWALKSPGWRKDWHVGVRVKSNGRLIAFISAIPADLRCHDNTFKIVEINFLCVHKKLRAKRLAPVLIKEITRRVNLTNIWQALYTAGVVLPSPASVCRYNHRPLNWLKLYEVGFSPLPDGATKSQMISKYALTTKTKIKGLREMKFEDIESVKTLLSAYLDKFDLVTLFSTEEVEHWFLDNSHEADNRVVYSYVVEDPETKEITDFFSFYLLPFTVLHNEQHNGLEIAYLYHYATKTSLDKPRTDKEATKKLQSRLIDLMNDALVLAHGLGVDVFNALSSQDNTLFLNELKFGLGDGKLNYYLFNYKSFPVNGGKLIKETGKWDQENRSGVAAIML